MLVIFIKFLYVLAWDSLEFLWEICDVANRRHRRAVDLRQCRVVPERHLTKPSELAFGVLP